MTRVARIVFAAGLVLVVGVRPSVFAQQIIDPGFDAKVARPAYTDRHPMVLSTRRTTTITRPAGGTSRLST